jgi:2-phosphoglycolate phosphatase
VSADGFRAVVFDLDGTLLDSYEGIRAALNPVLVHFGKEPVTVDQVRFMVGEGLPRLIEKAIGPEMVEEGVRLFRERYRETAVSGSALFHDAEEVMTELGQRGIPMSIASNKPALFSRQILESLGIAARFVFVGGPDIGFAPKPDPGMALAALAAMRTTAQETLFVGDMPIDLQTARAVGMRCALIPTGSSLREELEAARPEYFVDSLASLLPLFAGGSAVESRA